MEGALRGGMEVLLFGAGVAAYRAFFRRRLVAYEHKVGGHQSSDGMDLCRFAGRDEVLKRLQPQPYVLQERRFYEEHLPRHRDGVLRPILRYLPRFRGVTAAQGFTFLRLENLMSQFRKPCILDIKVGRRCYEPGASEAKKAKERKKYPFQQVVGYRAAGIKVWRGEDGGYLEMIRHSRTRTEQELRRGEDLLIYLQDASGWRGDVLAAFEEHVGALLQWFRRQTEFHFISASLLFAYEGDPHGRAEPRVWLVDFAHTFAGMDSPDDNFLSGIAFLHQILRRIAAERSASPPQPPTNT